MSHREPSVPGGPAPGPAPDVALEDVVIALQKTFSRVSADTARVAGHRARAMVSGSVGFRMSLSVAMRDEDRLLATPSGPIALELSGALTTDVRTEESPDAGATEPRS